MIKVVLLTFIAIRRLTVSGCAERLNIVSLQQETSPLCIETLSFYIYSYRGLFGPQVVGLSGFSFIYREPPSK